MTDNIRPLAEFMAGLDDEETAATKAAEFAVKMYDIERSNEKTAADAKIAQGVIIRNWLTMHPDETELVVGDWNLRAFMQRGGDTHLYDNPNVIAADNPRLYARLIQLNLLRIDDKAVTLAIKEGLITYGDLAGYVHEGERTPTLQVKAIR